MNVKYNAEVKQLKLDLKAPFILDCPYACMLV